MIELIGLAFGGVLRFAPEVLKFFNSKNERAHEREMLGLQIQADTTRAQLAMQTAETQGAITERVTELQAMIEAIKSQGRRATYTGNKWTDRLLAFAEMLSATVRPILTYWYCVFIYGAYKIATYSLVMQSGANWANAASHLYTPQDGAVMLSIISFWFVDRSLRKQAT